MLLPDRTNCTFIPPKKWVELRNCVWTGPSWYGQHHRISNIPEYENLQHLFVKILDVPLEPKLDDFLNYLVLLKQPRLEHRPRVLVKNIYDKLNAEAQRDPSSASRIK